MIKKPLDYCCGDMANALDNTSGEKVLRYESDTREFLLILYENSKPSGFLKPIIYCPWCGTELPKILNEEWCDTLKAEYGLTINDFWDEDGYWDESKIPQEFRTDEWWKKRGL